MDAFAAAYATAVETLCASRPFHDSSQIWLSNQTVTAATLRDFAR